MLRAVRLAVIWVLVLLLPWQNLFAATTRLACGGASIGHPDAAPADAGDRATAAHSHAHCHGDKAVAVKADAHKCGACASCCVGAIPAGAPIVYDPVVLTDVVDASVDAVPVAFLSEGLERPPRRFLA